MASSWRSSRWQPRRLLPVAVEVLRRSQQRAQSQPRGHASAPARRCRATGQHAPIAAHAAPADPPQPPRSAGAAQAPEAARLTPSVREQRNRADQNWDVRVPVKAGEHEIVVAFRRRPAVDETPRLPFLRPFPAGNNVPETRMGAALRALKSAVRTPRPVQAIRRVAAGFSSPPCRQRGQPKVMCQDHSLDVDGVRIGVR